MKSKHYIYDTFYLLNLINRLLALFFADNFALIIKLVKQYGDFIRVWLGPELNIVVSDPKDVEVSNYVPSISALFQLH